MSLPSRRAVTAAVAWTPHLPRLHSRSAPTPAAVDPDSLRDLRCHPDLEAHPRLAGASSNT